MSFHPQKVREMLCLKRIIVSRGIKKNRGTEKPENRGPDSGLEKPKTGYPGFSTQFLVPDFYRVTENRVIYIFFIFFS
jgi:hypothetical protein